MRRSLAILPIALLLTATPAIAQVRATLPGSIVESASVGAAERQQIDAYVTALSTPATGDDADAASKARLELVTPLRDNRPSVSFRQAYAKSAENLLGALLASEDPAARIAGLRLAGNLATGDTAALVSAGMTDPDAGVRVFAGTQARRIFEVSGRNGPALTNAQAADVVAAVVDALTSSDNDVVSQTLIRALTVAAQTRSDDLSSARTGAILGLSSAMSQRIRSAAPTDIAALQDTVLIASNAMTRALSDPGVSMSDANARAAAEMGGDVLSLLLTREIDGLNDADNTVDVRLLRSAESLVYFARRRQVENAKGNPSSVPQTDLAGLLESNDRGFRTQLVGLIGPGSAMLDQFGLADDRFIN